MMDVTGTMLQFAVPVSKQKLTAHFTTMTHVDNHIHRAEVPRLERGSNNGEPTITPVSLTSRSGSMRPPLPPKGVYDDAGSLRLARRNEGMSTPRRYGFLLRDPSPCLNQLHWAGDELQHEPTKA